MKLHIHVNNRKVLTVDLDTKKTSQPSAKELEAFVQLLLEAIARVESRTNDEEEGHEFHGNQYVTVAGQGQPDEEKEQKPKPTQATPGKGVKAATHELLSSGHPFTVEELMKATGAKNSVTLMTALSDLKSPKYAGKLGALQIVKMKSGHYQIVKGSTQAQPDIAKIDPDVTKVLKNIAAPATPKQPESIAADPAQPHKLTTEALTAKPHPSGKVSQADSNAYYNNGLDESLKAAAKAAAVSKGPAYSKLVALQWKQAKTNLMAQYSANMQGGEVKAKQLEYEDDVFPEDVAFIQKLGELHKQGASSGMFAQAYQSWKEATKKAKVAAANKPKASPQPAQAAKKVEPPPKGDPDLPKPKQLVPDNFKSVHHDDFVDGTFEKNMGELFDKLMAGHPDSVTNKKTVQARLESRLKDSKHWQWVKSKATGLTYNSLEASLIGAWASSSGDGHAVSCALQLAARDAFDMHSSHVETKALTAISNYGEEGCFKTAASAFGIPTDPESLKTFKAALQDFTLAQYHETQDHLKQLGVDHVYVARGMKAGAGHGKDQKVNLKLQPASSFSAKFATAKSFSKGKSLFLVKVPREQVLSSYVTGYGCTSEHEVVVLSHPKTQAVHIDANSASSLNAACTHIAKKVKKWA